MNQGSQALAWFTLKLIGGASEPALLASLALPEWLKVSFASAVSQDLTAGHSNTDRSYWTYSCQ
jgi:hypothetical protein